MNLRTSQLHPRFGVEVHDLDLRDLTAESGYPEVRALFEEHSLLLLRNQHLDAAHHLRVAALFGPIEDRSPAADSAPTTSAVSNRLDDGSVAAADSWQTLDLTGNQLWHTDSTFLPVPALANLLAARTLPPSGGDTELASTRAALADMPEHLRSRARAATVRHRLAHSRSKISAELAAMPHITRFDDQAWRAVWPNPVNGAEAVYIASHAYAVDGLDEHDGVALIEQLLEWCTRPEYVYAHRWRDGDVLVWDERATLHRGRPWPYEFERTLSSVCVSAGADDGLELVRPAVS